MKIPRLLPPLALTLLLAVHTIQAATLTAPNTSFNWLDANAWNSAPRLGTAQPRIQLFSPPSPETGSQP